MPRNVNDIIKQLRPTQRRKVEARAAQLIAGEMTLQELRDLQEGRITAPAGFMRSRTQPLLAEIHSACLTAKKDRCYFVPGKDGARVRNRKGADRPVV